MAHGDYDCCAICDCKMSYAGGNSDTKQDICTGCLKDLRDHGIPALDPTEFLTWAETVDPAQFAQVLADIGYSACYYDNSFDEAIADHLAKHTELENQP